MTDHLPPMAHEMSIAVENLVEWTSTAGVEQQAKELLSNIQLNYRFPPSMGTVMSISGSTIALIDFVPLIWLTASINVLDIINHNLS